MSGVNEVVRGGANATRAPAPASATGRRARPVADHATASAARKIAMTAQMDEGRIVIAISNGVGVEHRLNGFILILTGKDRKVDWQRCVGSFLEDEALFGEFLRTPVSEGPCATTRAASASKPANLLESIAAAFPLRWQDSLLPLSPGNAVQRPSKCPLSSI